MLGWVLDVRVDEKGVGLGGDVLHPYFGTHRSNELWLLEPHSKSARAGFH